VGRGCGGGGEGCVGREMASGCGSWREWGGGKWFSGGAMGIENKVVGRL